MIFAKLSRIYLSKWSDQFEDTDSQNQYMDEWMAGLAGLSGEQIAAGLEKCREQVDWPPSIAKFRKLAVGDGRRHVGRAYNPYQKILPKPRNLGVAKSAIAGLRSALRKAPTEFLFDEAMVGIRFVL